MLYVRCDHCAENSGMIEIIIQSTLANDLFTWMIHGILHFISFCKKKCFVYTPIRIFFTSVIANIYNLLSDFCSRHFMSRSSTWEKFVSKCVSPGIKLYTGNQPKLNDRHLKSYVLFRHVVYYYRAWHIMIYFMNYSSNWMCHISVMFCIRLIYIGSFRYFTTFYQMNAREIRASIH